MNKEVLAIIIIFTISIFLFALYFIFRIIARKSRLSRGNDIFTDTYNKFSARLKDKGSPIDVKMYILLAVAGSAGLSVGLLFLMKIPSLAAFGLIGGAFLPEIIVQVHIQMEKKEFEKDFMITLEQLSTSLKAGMSIAQSVDDIVISPFLPKTMRKRFEAISSDLKVGISISEAFSKFADNTGSIDARDVAIALTVQNEVGGKEAEVVSQIADNIHERITLRKEVRSAFSGTTAMVWMMDFIPALIMFIFLSTNSQYLNLYLNNPVYTVAFVIIICILVAGSVVNHRIMDRIKGSA